MNKEDLSFRTFGGSQPALCVAPSDGNAPRAIVGILPAVGIRADYYAGFLSALSEHGFAGVVADWIGAGASPVRASHAVSWSYEELVHHHASGLHEAARSRFGDVPFFWVGHSLGGHIAALHAGHAPTVSGVAFVASGSPYYKAWAGRERATMAGGALLVRGISAAMGYFPGTQLRFGERESAGWARDWYHVHRSGSFSHPGFDGDSLLRQMRAPVFCATVFDDRLAPAESTALLVARTSAQDVTRVTWNQGMAVGHNRWPRRLKDVATMDLSCWMNRQLSGRTSHK